MIGSHRHCWRRLSPVCALLGLLLGACGPAAQPTPTVSIEAIYTAAVQTFQAQQATQMALTPPTSSPSPTAIVTLPPPSPLSTFVFATLATGGGTKPCDNAAYVADVTIPDGTVMSPGQVFTKKWKLLNTGSCTWSTSYKVGFDSGTLMGGTPSFVTVPVPSGNQTDIAVSLTAPSTAGSYTGTWRMQNGAGQPFGSFITVVIAVGSSATVTPGPSPTAGAGTYTISGNAGAANARLDYAGTTSGSVTAGDNGDYSISVPSGWIGSITPTKGHYVFSPSSQSFTNVISDQTFNFTATQPEVTAAPTP